MPAASRRLALARLASLGALAAVPGLVLAQLREPAGSQWEPSRGQAGKDVIWLPTPDALVQRMLQMAEVRAGDHVFDLGSGDGKIAIAAGRVGARATGLEFNPQLVELSRRLAREAGVAQRVHFERADIFQADFSQATVVTMYLLPELNLRLRPRLFELPPGTRVVSHAFSMGEWQPDEQARVGNGELFLWRIPANASGNWLVHSPAAAGAPLSLQIRQSFQALRGEAEYGSVSAALISPRLSGAALQFGLRDGEGRLMHVQAQVQDGRMHGTLVHAGQAPQPFEARRQGAADAIVGSSYTEGGS